MKESRRAAEGLMRMGVLWALGAATARSTDVDALAQRALPGLGGALTVVPLAGVSWVLSEFPLHALAVEAAQAGRYVARGALRHGAGRYGLVAAGLAAAGLYGAHRQAKGAGGVLEAALREGLGGGYRGRLPTDDYPGEAPLTRRQVALPRFSERRRYLRSADLTYGEVGVRNHLDIWRRADLPDDARAPVLIQIHGSAWVAGSKRGQGYPLLAHMAERGWVGVAINYSLSPKAAWPAHIVDVKRAIAWVKAEIAAHGGDPGFVAITGGSAGGHLSALAGLTANEEEFQPGFEEADTSVAAAVPFYGVYDFLDRAHDSPRQQELYLERLVMQTPLAESRQAWDHASPLSWVRPDAPPFFVIHGAIDTFTRPAQARAFSTALRSASRQPVVYAELPGAQHAFDALPSVRTAHTVWAVDRFLSYVRSTRRAAVIAVPTRSAGSS